ncbi:hypothetical protein L207DRAFT_538059 [Hyaloscypha variabilis F]|uniref:Uncharacterized protein n=1 Tax=Hyaloscypha variabilis (strain UAMH 11265 / GT02V1 / F) TaxID=1149755 RepID=A0A2J6QV93_HYAVF|nr:hypothetical protein L207DRAFT_538059 [Hyaloscypha variabilis F]
MDSALEAIEAMQNELTSVKAMIEGATLPTAPKPPLVLKKSKDFDSKKGAALSESSDDDGQDSDWDSPSRQHNQPAIERRQMREDEETEEPIAQPAFPAAAAHVVGQSTGKTKRPVWNIIFLIVGLSIESRYHMHNHEVPTVKLRIKDQPERLVALFHVQHSMIRRTSAPNDPDSIYTSTSVHK